MPKQYRKEISFQAGEISPLFYGRSETEFYDKGLAIAENVFVEKRGGVFRRGGLEHFTQVDGDDARVFTKQISRARFDTIVLRNLQMVIGKGGSGVIDDTFVAPWTEAQLQQVHVTEESTGETLYFTHPEVAPQKLVL